MGTLSTRARNGMVAAATIYGGSVQLDRLQLLSGSTVLAQFSISWGSIGSGSVTASGLPQTVTASATGTVNGAKLYSTGDSQAFIQFDSNDIGTTGSGKPIEISSLSITSGQPVRLTGLSVTAPTNTTA